MKSLPRVALIGIALLGTACASFYTSIEKADDGSYTVTRVRQGFWRIYGTVYRCAATTTGRSLNCDEIDSPSR